MVTSVRIHCTSDCVHVCILHLISFTVTTVGYYKWREAMDKEMESLKANDVYDLVELPEGKKVIGCKWVFKRKLNDDGTVNQYKARLVAQGFSQTYGLDFDEMFCPVVRFESIRSIIAIAVQSDLILHQMDVTSAFLNGKLEEV